MWCVMMAWRWVQCGVPLLSAFSLSAASIRSCLSLTSCMLSIATSLALNNSSGSVASGTLGWRNGIFRFFLFTHQSLKKSKEEKEKKKGFLFGIFFSFELYSKWEKRRRFPLKSQSPFLAVGGERWCIELNRRERDLTCFSCGRSIPRWA